MQSQLDIKRTAKTKAVERRYLSFQLLKEQILLSNCAQVVMRPAVVTVTLPVLLLFFISIPAVSGDCYDEPPNNKSYDNCATCFQTLANALMDTEDNKYRLSNGFFPDNAATPIQVRVEYIPKSQCNTTNKCKSERHSVGNDSTRWYWLVGEFYIYQPVHLFLYRSLFFSPPAWRTQCIVLCLPKECIDKKAETFDDFFNCLTQRVG